LAKYGLTYARANNLTEGRVRAWISCMITAGILERATGVIIADAHAGLVQVSQFVDRIITSAK
jgi:hypothetical protein